MITAKKARLSDKQYVLQYGWCFAWSNGCPSPFHLGFYGLIGSKKEIVKLKAIKYLRDTWGHKNSSNNFVWKRLEKEGGTIVRCKIVVLK